MNIRSVIDAYYKHREYKQPEALEALLFLISEVGEVAEAYGRSVYDPELLRESSNAAELLSQMIEIGTRADALVSGRKAWVRNNERAERKIDLDGEIADVFMMLDRLALSLNKRSPITLLFEKMRKKGFVIEQAN